MKWKNNKTFSFEIEHTIFINSSLFHEHPDVNIWPIFTYTNRQAQMKPWPNVKWPNVVWLEVERPNEEWPNVE
jgi:hypothetical protein